jgi:hypothetical protein
MHVIPLLHKLFGKSLSIIHKKRVDAICTAVQALVTGRRLSLTGIGRSIQNEVMVKHNIKRIDRLLGNKKLVNERVEFYAIMAEYIIQSENRPLILIDWSVATQCGDFQMLKATIPMKGRSLTIYEEVHPEKKLNNREVHKKFIKTLKSILPDNCKPIIITDAGFRNPWFLEVKKQGWDYIGRLRNNTLCKLCEDNGWVRVKTLFDSASKEPKHLGEGVLGKTVESVNCGFYIVKEKDKKRVKKNLKGKKIQCSSSLKHAKRESEPMLIVTSLDRKEHSPAKIIRIYKKRMQIEETFRDLKSINMGLCFRSSRSGKASRLEILLLLAALANLIITIIGIVTKSKKQHYQFQANTVKNRDVLSVFFIGCQVLRRQIEYSLSELWQSFNIILKTIKSEGYL